MKVVTKMSEEIVQKMKILIEERDKAHLDMPLISAASAVYHSIVEIKYQGVMLLLIKELLELLHTSEDTAEAS